jgi:membrane fusion protein, multidrug efflux system
VQRVPVRLALDPVGDDTPLQAGLSVNVEVDTRHVRSLPSFLAWINAGPDLRQ